MTPRDEAMPSGPITLSDLAAFQAHFDSRMNAVDEREDRIEAHLEKLNSKTASHAELIARHDEQIRYVKAEVFERPYRGPAQMVPPTQPSYRDTSGPDGDVSISISKRWLGWGMAIGGGVVMALMKLWAGKL